MTKPDPYLTLTEVIAAFREAGYRDSEATIRRMVDAGDFGEQGTAWYRTERGGRRHVRASAVRALLARRGSAS